MGKQGILKSTIHAREALYLSLGTVVWDEKRADNMKSIGWCPSQAASLLKH